MEEPGAAARPLRADAARNRSRVLEAAHAAFASSGRAVPLDEIARLAGVGAGTVYRHFPTKEALFEAVLVDRMARLGQEVHTLAGAENPGQAFFELLPRVVEQAGANRALCEALGDLEIAPELVQGFESALGVLLRRAQRAGDVRDDVDVRDIRALLIGCVAMSSAGLSDRSAARLTAIAVDGLRSSRTRNSVTKPSEPSVGFRNEPASAGMACEVCGAEVPAADTGRPARYCGAACRQKAHRRRRASANPVPPG